MSRINKVKIIIRNTYEDLEDAINLFLSDKLKIYVKDIKYNVQMIGEDVAEITAMIIYIECKESGENE